MTLRSLKAFVLAGVASFIGVAYASAGTVMECQMNEAGTRGWVPSKLFVQVGDTPDEFQIWGRAEAGEESKWNDTRLVSASANSIKTAWTFNTQTNQRLPLRVRYRMEFNPENNDFNVRVDILSSRQSEFSRGRCKVFQG